MTDQNHLDSTTIFDRDTALGRLCGSEETLRNVITIFFDQGPQLVRDMRDAAVNEDLEALERAAHTLRGSAGVLAANEVARLALEIETSARNQDLARSVGSLDEMDRAVCGVIRALTDYVALTL